MDRRDFLKTGGAVAARAAAGGAAAQQPLAPAVQSGVMHLLLVSSREPDTPCFAARRLARRLETVSGGHFSVELRNGSAAEADFTFGGANEHARYHPAFAF